MIQGSKLEFQGFSYDSIIPYMFWYVFCHVVLCFVISFVHHCAWNIQEEEEVPQGSQVGLASVGLLVLGVLGKWINGLSQLIRSRLPLQASETFSPITSNCMFEGFHNKTFPKNLDLIRTDHISNYISSTIFIHFRWLFSAWNARF